MKFVKRTISIPKDLHKFGEELARELAKQDSSDPNFSLVVRRLLTDARTAKEKSRLQPLPKAA